MKNYKMMRSSIISLLLLLFVLSAATVTAQSSPVITVQNVASLEMSAEIGRGSATAIALSPDDAYLAVAAGQNVLVYDLADKSLLHVLKGHTGTVNAVAFSSAGVLASGGEDKTVRLWNPQNGTALNVLEGQSGAILALDFSGDGQAVAAIGQGEYEARVWHVETGTELQVLRGHESASRALSFAPQGTGLLTADLDGVANLWNAQSGELRQTLTIPGDVFDFVIGPTHLASAHFSGTILLNNMATGESFTLQAEAGVDSLDFNSDGSLLVSTDRSGKVTLWDTATGQVVREIEQGKTAFDSAKTALFTADDSQIITLTVEGIVYRWDVNTGRLADSFAVDTREINSIAYSPDGTLLALGSAKNKAVSLWDTQTLSETGSVYMPEGSSRAIAMSPDGALLAAAGDGDYAVRLIDVATQQVVATLPGHTEIVKQVTFSPDGKYVFSGGGSFFADSSDNTVRMWDVATGRTVHVFDAATRSVEDFAVAPAQLAVVSADDMLRFYDVNQGVLLEKNDTSVADVKAVRFSPDGGLVAVTTGDGEIHMAVYVTGQVPVGYGSSNSTDFAFHPQGALIATVYDGTSVVLTDAITGDELFTWEPEPRRYIGTVLFNPAGTQLAIAYDDGLVELWSVGGGSAASSGGKAAVDVPAVPLPQTYTTGDGLLTVSLPDGWSASDGRFEASATVRSDTNTMMVVRARSDTTLADVFTGLQVNSAGDNIAVYTEEFLLGERDAARADVQSVPSVRDYYFVVDLGGGWIAQIWFSDLRQEFEDLQPTLLAILDSAIVPGMETAATGAPSTGDSGVQLPETFTTIDGSLTFSHPTEWVFRQDDAASPAYTDRDVSGVTIQIEMLTDTTLDKVAASFEEQSPALASEEFTLDDRSAVRVETSLFRGIRDYRYGIDLGNGRYGTLWLVDQNDEFATLEPTLLAMLASMTAASEATVTQPVVSQVPELDSTITSYSKSFTVSYPSSLLEASAAERTPDNITMASDFGILSGGGLHMTPGDILLIVDYGDAEALGAAAGADVRAVAEANHDSAFGTGTAILPVTIGDRQGAMFDMPNASSTVRTRMVFLDTGDGKFAVFWLMATSQEELDGLLPTYTAIIESFKVGTVFERMGPAGLEYSETFVRDRDGYTIPYPAGWRVTVDIVGQTEYVIVTKGQPFDLSAPPAPGKPFAIVAYGLIGDLTGLPTTMLNPETNAGRVIQTITGAAPDALISLKIAGLNAAMVTSNTDNFDNVFVAIMQDDAFFVAANIYTAPGEDLDFPGAIMDMLVMSGMGEAGATTAAAPDVALSQFFTGEETALTFGYPEGWTAVEVSAELVALFTPSSALTAMTKQEPPAPGELQVLIYTENVVGTLGNLDATVTILGQTAFVNDLNQTGAVTVGSLPAMRYDGQVDAGDVLALFIETPSGVVFMRATAPAGEMAQHEAALLAIAGSMGE